MRDSQPSRTALATAYLRAAHKVPDAPPRIFEDPSAITVLGESASASIHTDEAWYRTPEARALRAHVVLRSRRVTGTPKRRAKS